MTPSVLSEISSRHRMAVRKFPAKFSSLAEIGRFISGEADIAGLVGQASYAVQIAVDEACTNIIEHAYGGESGEEIEIITKILDNGIELVLKDGGISFDPQSVPEPDSSVPLNDLAIGGAGVFLIKKMMDEVDYHFDSRGTILTMRKLKQGV